MLTADLDRRRKCRVLGGPTFAKKARNSEAHKAQILATISVPSIIHRSLAGGWAEIGIARITLGDSVAPQAT
jgi:hypothetical protein